MAKQYLIRKKKFSLELDENSIMDFEKLTPNGFFSLRSSSEIDEMSELAMRLNANQFINIFVVVVFVHNFRLSNKLVSAKPLDRFRDCFIGL